jgi:AcrR family transcriptional regulator
MTSHPFTITRDERRASLSRHFAPVVEALAEGGEAYGDLSVERIIKAGGISRSAFYNYFDDKVDLLVAMATDAISDLVGSGEAWWAMPSDGTKEDLREALRIPLENYRSRHMILGAVVEVATYDERVREQQRLLVDQVATALGAHIAEAQASGTADPALNADRTARWVVWMLERGLYQLVTPADEGEAEQLLDDLTEIIWRIFYAGWRDESPA